MKRLLSYYHPKAPIILAYMVQQVEYSPSKFLKWIFKFPDLTRVMRRQNLIWTHKARTLVLIIIIFYLFYLLLAVAYLYIMPVYAPITLLVAPFFIILLTYLVVLFGWLYYEEPRRRKLIKEAAKRFEKHPGIKIAIAGSYGKTSMKELLNTVLSQSKVVAATPGNKNVPVSHAAWVKKLTGEENILLIEYGEGAPGDIKKLTALTHPDYGIITGLAPNHLDEYKNLSAVAEDLLSIQDSVKKKNLYINNDVAALSEYDLSNFEAYSHQGALGWTTSKVSIDYSGTSFELKKNKKTIKVNSGLVGEHHVGPLTLAAALANHLGLSIKDIEAGLENTQPFEHRMQPRHLHGAWIIDDAYNGSLEGIRAGTKLMKQLKAKRKIYVTPGLVDQGEETERVHKEIGELIAEANPDRVVLINNSVTDFIKQGLNNADYKGELQIETDPLKFYNNIEHILAGGDLIMLQNDWTDNYS